MASFSLLTLVVIISSLFNFCCCFNPKLNVSMAKSDQPKQHGGACGYDGAVSRYPFCSMVSAGGPSLFKSGKGCGACYQVKCTQNGACSGNPVTVVITDECRGPPCSITEPVHFDLSGTAFGAMAAPGKANELRNAGVLQIQYKRVMCNYPHMNVAFHVYSGSSPYYFATVVEFEDGEGGLAAVELQQDGRNWVPMQQLWGAIWKLNSGWPLAGPLCLRLTTGESRKTLVADKVIPAGWQPGKTYRSLVNFDPKIN